MTLARYSLPRLARAIGILAGLWLAAVTPRAPAQEARIHVYPSEVTHELSRYMTGACIEDINHEIYGGLYSQMIFGESFQEPAATSGELTPGADGVSRWWRPLRRGSAVGRFAVERARRSFQPFLGSQSQRLAMIGGQGEVGIENRGLNRWGLCFQAGKPYEGRLWARAERATDLYVALESGDGSRIYDEVRLPLPAGGTWRRLDFRLTPNGSDAAGRLAVKLKRSGDVLLGYAFLQPGPWGRFKGLPVRRDIAEALLAQGLTVMRCGGAMVNSPEYRWKEMIGPRDRRRPYRGSWYPYSTNGFGIFEFLDFCEAAGLLGIPDLNSFETPQDMADFPQMMSRRYLPQCVRAEAQSPGDALDVIAKRSSDGRVRSNPGGKPRQPTDAHGTATGGRKRGQAPFVRSTRRAVPAKGACPLFRRGGRSLH